MIDLSCLEDICGDPNVLLKPVEHIVWVVRERVRSVLCGLGKPAQVKKKKKKISPQITHEIAKEHKATTNFQCKICWQRLEYGPSLEYISRILFSWVCRQERNWVALERSMQCPSHFKDWLQGTILLLWHLLKATNISQCNCPGERQSLRLLPCWDRSQLVSGDEGATATHSAETPQDRWVGMGAVTLWASTVCRTPGQPH